MTGSHFDNIESAHQYICLLADQVAEVSISIQTDIDAAISHEAMRRLDGLRLVEYKLQQLTGNLCAARRVLNDLRALRRVLTAESGSCSAVDARAYAPGREAAVMVRA